MMLIFIAKSEIMPQARITKQDTNASLTQKSVTAGEIICISDRQIVPTCTLSVYENVSNKTQHHEKIYHMIKFILYDRIRYSFILEHFNSRIIIEPFSSWITLIHTKGLNLVY